jgi:hypothetical protein
MMEFLVEDPVIWPTEGTDVENVAINNLAKLCFLLYRFTDVIDSPSKQDTFDFFKHGLNRFFAPAEVAVQLTQRADDLEQEAKLHTLLVPCTDGHTTETASDPPLLPNACNSDNRSRLVQFVIDIAFKFSEYKLVVVISVKADKSLEIL